MLNVHVRVTDGTTGRPIPVRIRITDAEGHYRPPLGRLGDFSLDEGIHVGDSVQLAGLNYAYIDGTCEVPLPPGPITVQISRGPEYTPLIQTVPLATGQLALRFTLTRWTDWREQGWYAGDLRVHDLSPQSALLEGAAEGLATVQLLARHRIGSSGQPDSLTNITAFSGTVPALSSPECLVAVNTFNVHPQLGSLSLLHSHRAVFPLRSGSPGPDDWSVADWCDQCHRKKGLVVWSARHGEQGEVLASAILGKIDAIELTSFSDPSWGLIADYYHLLDAGFRIALTGASGKDSNRTATGSVRTYAKLQENATFSADTWIAAVRAGRTFLTSGPLVSFLVNGQLPGATVRVQKGEPVRIRAEVLSATPLDEFGVVAGGQTIAFKPAYQGRHETIDFTWTPSASTWLAARCFGRARLSGCNVTAAHTSPVWIEVDGQPKIPDRASVSALQETLQRTLAWVERAACPTEKHREHYQEILRTADAELSSRLDHGVPLC